MLTCFSEQRIVLPFFGYSPTQRSPSVFRALSDPCNRKKWGHHFVTSGLFRKGGVCQSRLFYLSAFDFVPALWKGEKRVGKRGLETASLASVRRRSHGSGKEPIGRLERTWTATGRGDDNQIDLKQPFLPSHRLSNSPKRITTATSM